MDNLKNFIVFLVIAYHAGLVYESSGIGAYFWIVDDPMTNDLSGMINLILDIFIMPTMFFISGFFTPSSLKKKGTLRFLGSKFKRLMVPWAIAVFALIPIYKYIFLYSRNIPQQGWTTYLYFKSGFSHNWLWFLPVLFLFSLLYLLLSKLNINVSKITLKKAVIAIFLVGLVYSFCMKIFNFHGWTKTAIIDFQNERLLIYLMMFLLGSFCFKLKTFDVQRKSKKLSNFINWTSWIPITLYLGLVIYSFIKPGEYIISRYADQLLIRFFYHVSLLSLLYSVINLFRYSFNRSGKFIKILNRNSYGVYIIHTIVLGGIALLLLNIGIPSILKYVILALSTYIVSNLIIYLKDYVWKLFLQRGIK